MANSNSRDNESHETITTAEDLMKLDLEDDFPMLDELSLCSVCSYTCFSTAS